MESSSSHSETFLTNSSSGREEIYSVGCTKVYKFTKDGHTYAQKCIIKKSSNKKRIKRQMRVCQKLIKKQNKHIVKIYECVETQGSLTITMDYYKYTLQKYIMRKWADLASNPSIGFSIFLQILYSLAQLYQTHRDLKPQNIFVEELQNGQVNVRLGDFGESKCLKVTKNSKVGTQPYMAPEVRKQLPYDSKADVWSLGTIAYQLFNGKDLSKVVQPMNLQFPFNEFFLIWNIDQYYQKDIYEYDINFHYRTGWMIPLIKKMLQVDPQDRISLNEIYDYLYQMKKQIQFLENQANFSQFMEGFLNLKKRNGQKELEEREKIKIRRFYEQVILYLKKYMKFFANSWLLQLFYGFVLKVSERIKMLQNQCDWVDDEMGEPIIKGIKETKQSIESFFMKNKVAIKDGPYYMSLWNKKYEFIKHSLQNNYFLKGDSKRLITQINNFW